MMIIVSKISLGLFSAFLALSWAQDSKDATKATTCSNGVPGIEDAEGTACCDLGCINPSTGLPQCGGPKCGSFGGAGRGASCCVGPITASGDDCALTDTAPCFIAAATCSNSVPGIEDAEGTACCDLGCINPSTGLPQCGGPKCGSFGGAGRGASCCVGPITASGDDCALTDTAPCFIAAATCSNGVPGIEDAEGTACCDLGCINPSTGLPQCGGPKCGSFGGAGRGASCCVGPITASGDDCALTDTAPCFIADGMTTAAPMTTAPTPAAPAPTTPAPTAPASTADACNPNPCLNGSTCEIDPAGGHQCTCSGDEYLGMQCQIKTEGLAEFFIELDFVGSFTPAQREVFEAAAARWSEVVSHVPCGGSAGSPPGRLLITATLEEIDGPYGLLASGGAWSTWGKCPTISATGGIRFDAADIEQVEHYNNLFNLVLHEMGHTIGVGTHWELPGEECTSCLTDGSAEWTCPALIRVYNDLLADSGGREAEVVEIDFGEATRCYHLDKEEFQHELMTGVLTSGRPPALSKLTAASLEDISYIVDPSGVDAYALPGFSIPAEEAGLYGTNILYDTDILHMSSVPVERIVNVMDETGIVGETTGLMMETYMSDY